MFTFTISFSFTSTSTSILFRLAILRISVPAICCVPKTLSPNSTFNNEIVPSAGA